MNIAELFVDLGVAGSQKAKGAFQEVKGGLKETGSMALETKAALVAALYAVERLFSSSSKAGSGLTNFNAELGVSVDTLQRYQYAAQQVGVSNESVSGSFKALQQSMTKILMGEGAPKGLARVALTVGDMSPEDIARFQKQPQLLMQKLQEYAKKETNIGLRNEVLKSFGLGDDMIAALSRQAFKPQVLSKAPVYSEGEVKSLDRNNAAWKNLGQKIEMAFGRFNAKHGAEIIDGLSRIIEKVVQLAEAFTVLAEKLKLFEWFGKAIEGWTQIFTGITGAVDDLSGAMDDPKKKEALKEKTKTWFTNDLPLYADQLFRGILGEDAFNQQTKAIEQMKAKMVPPKGETGNRTLPGQTRKSPLPDQTGNRTLPGQTQRPAEAPSSPALAPAIPPSSLAPVPSSATTNNNQRSSSVNVNVNQTNQFGATDPADKQKVQNNLKDSARSAFRQMAGQTLGA